MWVFLRDRVVGCFADWNPEMEIGKILIIQSASAALSGENIV